jgi:hypothetical protein
MPSVEAPPRRGQAASQPPQRRTVVIRGQVAPPPRVGGMRSTARRGRPRRAHERIAGSRPDRAALWAVLMGVFLILTAILTAHGA